MLLPKPVQTALQLLEQNGFEAYVVGGCVRDLLLGLQPTDYDITTNALPGQTQQVFQQMRVIETGKNTGQLPCGSIICRWKLQLIGLMGITATTGVLML